MTRHRLPLRRGFTLLEALIALAIVAFGLLGLAGVNMTLTRGEEIARQRGEATRLAQERIEQLRSFQCVTADGCTVPGALLFTGLTSGNDSISQSAEYQTNTTFQRSWQVLGDASDTMRRVVVTVAWTDRTGEAQSVALATVIARVDPTDIGSLGFPLPANTTLKRPKNRSMNIPVPAIELKKYPGHSAYNFGSYAIVFSNDSGYVVKKCDFEVNADSDVSECAVYDAYILAGHVSMHDGLAFPPGLAVNIGLPLTEGATAGSTCSAVEVARDQNNPDPNTNQIPGFKYYLCVMKVPKTGDVWSGMVRLAAPALKAGATDYIVCRFQYPKEVFGGNDNERNVQPYKNVGQSLDSQNYVIATGSACPKICPIMQTTKDGKLVGNDCKDANYKDFLLQTTAHQVCGSTNANRAADCPAG